MKIQQWELLLLSRVESGTVQTQFGVNFQINLDLIRSALLGPTKGLPSLESLAGLQSQVV